MNKVIFLFLLLAIQACGVSNNPINALPQPGKKMSKASLRKWSRVTHFKESQKEIARELIANRYLKISEIEQNYGQDKKMIFKEARPVNSRFFDNLKDMMTAYQWHTFDEYQNKRIEKLKKKRKVEVLGYYDFWTY